MLLLLLLLLIIIIMREREEAPLREEGFGYRTRNFYTPYFHVNRRHGKRVLAIPFQTGAADLHQERRTLC